MNNRKLLKQQASALRQANDLLRQAVPPERQKLLPQRPERAIEPPTLKERMAKLLPKMAKALAVVVVLGAIGALIAVEISILSSKKEEAPPVTEELPESLPYADPISGLNAYFGGCATEYGDRLYFLSSLKDELYYLDAAGNPNKVLKTSASNLFAADCYVYYINGKTNVIEKINVHNGNTLSLGLAVCTSAIIGSDGLYCTAIEDGALRKYTPRGNKYEEIFSEKIRTVDKMGETLYILTDSGELREIKGTETRLMAENIHLSGIINRRLFFSDGEKLYALNGGAIEDTGLKAKDFNGNGTFTVLQDPEKDTMLTLHTGENSYVLAADYAGGLTVTENYIVYTSVDGYRYMICPKKGSERTLLP